MAPRVRNTVTGKLLQSKRGKRLLAANGHIYTVNQKRPDAKTPTINWRCVKTALCSGSAKTGFLDLDNVPVNTTIPVTLMKRHLHDPDEAGVIVEETVNEIKRRARLQPNGAPSSIIQEVTNEIESEEVLMRLPERQPSAKHY